MTKTRNGKACAVCATVAAIVAASAVFFTGLLSACKSTNLNFQKFGP